MDGGKDFGFFPSVMEAIERAVTRSDSERRFSCSEQSCLWGGHSGNCKYPELRPTHRGLKPGHPGPGGVSPRLSFEKQAIQGEGCPHSVLVPRVSSLMLCPHTRLLTFQAVGTRAPRLASRLLYPQLLFSLWTFVACPGLHSVSSGPSSVPGEQQGPNLCFSIG